MAKIKLKKQDRIYLKNLGNRIREIILEEKDYSSLDRFALEFHDQITKPTLYAICDGKRDLQFSTLSGLSNALGIKTPLDLLNQVQYRRKQD